MCPISEVKYFVAHPVLFYIHVEMYFVRVVCLRRQCQTLLIDVSPGQGQMKYSHFTSWFTGKKNTPFDTFSAGAPGTINLGFCATC